MKCNTPKSDEVLHMERKYKHLMTDERNPIHRCRHEGFSLRAIARRLKRPASTRPNSLSASPVKRL
jgi:DNA-directed RNA polymerase specialized sigma24 family protein